MDEIAVARLADIPDGDYRIFALDALEVGIFRSGNRVVAYENVCPHAGGPVCQG
jgi:nitrite reductase/ring-hydroxylating ferredoxin subunit